MSLLEKAIQLALSVHTGQRDKGGAPCILHPLRVMNEMRSESEMIVAVLHDVIEDTSITYVDLQSEGFKQDIIDAVALLHVRRVKIIWISLNDAKAMSWHEK